MFQLQKRVLVLTVGMILAGSLNQLQAQRPLLSITSPTDGTVITVPVSSGQTTITITVSADPSIQNIAVLTENPLPDPKPSSASNQFTLTIPNTIAPGAYHLTAVGENTAGAVQSVPIAIHVERQGTPRVLTAGPESIQFQAIGDTVSIIVTGTYSDGAVLDVTRSSMTSYTSSNTNVATVNSSGTVTAVGPGSADIIVQTGLANNPPAFAVDVKVAQPMLTNLVPASGPSGTLVTVSGFAFGDNRGDSTVTFSGIGSTPTSWSASSIIVRVPTGIPVGNANVVVSINGSVPTNTLAFSVTEAQQQRQGSN
jgi:trimeric autotransporter adhesin